MKKGSNRISTHLPTSTYIFSHQTAYMFYETRNYGKVCEHFDDFGLCDDAMLAWAIDLGWDLDSVLTETENALENDLYSDENPQYNFFYEIVNDAIGFIVSCLPAK